MTKNLNALLDKCIDRMNEGESLEECLTSYPEYAKELKPLLKAVWDFRDACSPIPRATAKSVVRRRLDAALVNSERGLRKPQRRPTRFFGWSRVLATVSIVLVLALIGFGLNWMLTPGVSPVVAQDNFRLLLSDDETAIGDFRSLEVTITSIGMLRAGEGGGWEVIEFEPKVVPLTPLKGLNAQVIWSGSIPVGEYTHVFIYIEDAKGTLKNGEPANVILPSGNLQIAKPFEITADDPVVSFVYDVAVVAAGDDYVLLPQVDQSGTNQSHHEVGEGQLIIDIVDPEPPYDPVDTAVTPGDRIRVKVTRLEDPTQPVLGAEVKVNGEHYGNTNEDGLSMPFIVPYDEELKIKAKKYEEGVELEGKLRIDYGDELTIQVVDPEHPYDPVPPGEVTPGMRVRALVTFETLQGPTIRIPGAEVEVNDEDIGETDGDGLSPTFTVPDDEDELEIKAVKDELEGKLEIELEEEHHDVGESKLTLQVVDADTLEVIDDDDVTPGQSVRVLVTLDGSPVEGALVTVNDDYFVGNTSDEVGQEGCTDPFIVPPDEDELEIKAVKDGLKGKLEIELEQD